MAIDAPEKRIQTVSVDTIRAHPALLQAHLNEVTPGRTADPSWRDYYVLEESGHLACFGCFVGDSLVGYAVLFTRPHQHDVKRTLAVSDLVYVSPSWRATFGRALLRAVEDEMADEVDEVQWSAPPGSKFNQLLRKLPGYEVADMVFVKRF